MKNCDCSDRAVHGCLNISLLFVFMKCLHYLKLHIVDLQSCTAGGGISTHGYMQERFGYIGVEDKHAYMLQAQYTASFFVKYKIVQTSNQRKEGRKKERKLRTIQMF